MGKTLVEKILTRASGKKQLTPGDIFWAKLDFVSIMDMQFRLQAASLREANAERVWDPHKIAMIVDHYPQVTSSSAADSLKAMREFATNQGITAFYDVGRQGISCQILAENGHVRPGMLVGVDDNNSENLGALGAVVIGLSNETYAAAATGEYWFKMPSPLKFTVNGNFSNYVTSWDLNQKIMGDFGKSGLPGKSIEFTGSTINTMSIGERITLCSQLYQIDVLATVIEPDEKTVRYVKERTKEPFEVVKSDPNSEYENIFDYAVSDLEPQVAPPPSRMNSKAVSEVEGIEIDQACIGSCTAGRLEDLRIAAQILKGRKVHPRVRLLISPVSQRTYLEAARAGIIETLTQANASIVEPSCGICYGYVGNLAEGEVCISTTTINYPGRMGSREAKIYLASPATVAASAVEGKITNPTSFMNEVH